MSIIEQEANMTSARIPEWSACHHYAAGDVVLFAPGVSPSPDATVWISQKIIVSRGGFDFELPNVNFTPGESGAWLQMKSQTVPLLDWAEEEQTP